MVMMQAINGVLTSTPPSRWPSRSPTIPPLSNCRLNSQTRNIKFLLSPSIFTKPNFPINHGGGGGGGNGKNPFVFSAFDGVGIPSAIVPVEEETIDDERVLNRFGTRFDCSEYSSSVWTNVQGVADYVSDVLVTLKAAIRNCFCAGFSAQKNFVEVIEKGEDLGTVSKSTGIMLRLALSICIQYSKPLVLASFGVATRSRMFCNVEYYHSFLPRTLNPYRASLIFGGNLFTGRIPLLRGISGKQPFSSVGRLFSLRHGCKDTKFGKQHRGRMKGLSYCGNTICFGQYGLQALEPSWITHKQLEAGRKAIIRHARRGGKVWIRVFPDKPVTARPAETRMGSGKGSVAYWVAVVQPGRILYEIGGVPEKTAREASRIAAAKIPIRTQFISLN